MEKAEPRASLAEHRKRLEVLGGQVKKWNDHAGLYQKARASLVGRSLEDPVFGTLAKDGIADRAAERLQRGRKALAEAFRLLEEKLDAGGAVASLGAAKEELKGLEGAGPWIDGCLARVKKLEGLLPGMAPVPAGKVKIPDEAAPQQVAPFFIDRFEVSVDDYRRFLDAFRGKSPEELRASFPDLKGLDAASFRECFSEPRYLSEVPPPNGNWPIETVTYQQARAYSLWLGKNLFTRAEWWLAARGDLEKGQRDFPCLFQQLKRSGDYPDPVDVGCQSVGFSSRTPVYHLSGNVAEWVKALPGAETAQLIGGSYKDREKREKFNGEVPDNRELRRSLRGYGFRGVVRPREFFRDLLPKS
jgi:formylglycine-generating enzyme required for sulfatase activity